MAINISDIREYTNNAPAYINGLVFRQSGVEKKDIDCLIMWLRRLCDENEGLSFRLITSTHESKGRIYKETIYSGKAGRPKTVVIGKEAVSHYHGLLINENPDIKIKRIRSRLQSYLHKRCLKRSSLKRPQITNVWENNLSIVKYMNRQATNTYTYGRFNFNYFLSPCYITNV